MCQNTLTTHPCGHSHLTTTTPCPPRELSNLLSLQLSTAPPPPSPHTSPITHHSLTPLPCPYPSCSLPFPTRYIPTASHLLHSLHLSRTFLLTSKSHWKTLLLRNALQHPKSRSRSRSRSNSTINPNSKSKLQHCKNDTTPKPKPKTSTSKKLEKGWAKVLMHVEKRIDRAETIMYKSLAGNVEVAAKATFDMPESWHVVVQEIHFGVVELGALRARVVGDVCRC